MESPAIIHPHPDDLKSFGLGRLDPGPAVAVQSHIEECDACRRVVAESSSDGFLDRVRAARPRDETPSPIATRSPGADAAVSDPATAGIPPELLNSNEYTAIVELGRGGMGVVYKAHNRLMARDEVLKVMGRDVMARPGALDRFSREIRAAAQLDHPNIVRAYAARTFGDLLVFSMEHVPGDELGKLVGARGPLPIVNACVYAQQVANGLQHAHERGMVHRDIKPANLMRYVDAARKRHTVKILDFGLAKVGSEAGIDTGLTGAGRMMGTPDYIAPEQITDARSADIRADIYALGGTLHYLLTGRPPFRADSLYDLLRKHQEEELDPLNFLRPEVPAELAGVVRKMMAKDPTRRFQTPAEVVRALAAFTRPGAKPPALELSQEQPAAAARPATVVPTSPPPPAPARPVTVVPTSPPPPAPTPAPNAWETFAFTAPAGVPPSSSYRASGRIPGWTWPAGVAGLLVVVLTVLGAAGAFRIKTKEGTIVLENLPADAEVLVDDEVVTVSRKGDEATVRVTTGGPPHRLKIIQGDRVIGTSDATIEVGGEPVRVRVESPKPQPPVADKPVEKPTGEEAPEPPFQPLSGGKLWDRWYKLRFGQQGEWTFGPEEMELQYTPRYIADNPVYSTRRDDFHDFEVSFEVQLNSGSAFFGFRDLPDIRTGNRAYPVSKGRGYAVLLADRIAKNKQPWAQRAAGSLFLAGGSPVPLGPIEPLAAATADCWKVAEWNTVEVSARGNVLSVAVNGQPVATHTDKSAFSRSGRFSFTPVGKTTLRFRNFRVKELAAAPIPPVEEVARRKSDPQFTSLFNGTDLAGWKAHPQSAKPWVVEAGLLSARGPQAYLYTERADYRNYHLRAVVRVNERGTIGLFLRAPFGAETPAGYQVELAHPALNQDKGIQGKVTVTSHDPKAATLTEVRNDGPKWLSPWITLDVIALGNRVEVKLEGESVAEYTLPDGHRPAGHVALKHPGPGTVVEFLAVEIKELP